MEAAVENGKMIKVVAVGVRGRLVEYPRRTRAVPASNWLHLL